MGDIPSTRFENKWFQLAKKYSDESAENFDKIFGKPVKKFCDTCGKLPVWCECKKCPKDCPPGVCGPCQCEDE